MVDETTKADDGLIADGVDEEPVEGNRRAFTGWRLRVVAGFGALYALLHMAALNGVSISNYTGITIPLLPRFPVETWNFRIAHISGALGLGFLLYNAMLFSDEDEQPHARHWSMLGYLFMLPALLALATTISVSYTHLTLPTIYSV